MSHLVGSGRLDVHGEHSEFMCHLVGPLRGSYAARHLPQHHVDEEGQVPDCRHLGALVCDLLPAAGRMEGQAGELLFVVVVWLSR